MGISTSSGLTSVTGNVTVDVSGGVTFQAVPTGWTTAEATAVNAATTDIRTVPAGKKLIILWACLTEYVGGAFSGIGRLKDDTGAVFMVTAGAGTGATGAIALNWPYPSGPTVAAGQKLQVQNTAASTTATVNVAYIEVDA